MAKLKSKVNFKKKLNALRDIRKLVPIANQVKNDIRSRTQDKGLDVNNKAFKKYSDSYAKSKRQTHGSSKPNLTRTGQMLNAIDWKLIKNGVRFFFNSAEQNAKAYFNQVTNKRKFFGVDRKSKSELEKKLREIYLKALSK